MKKIALWVKKQFETKNENWREMSSSIQKMAAENGINRRRNARINYPNSNYSAKLPMIIYKGKVENSIDISLGGVCIDLPDEENSHAIGDVIPLSLRWKNEPEQNIDVKVVGQSHEKLHLQFQQLPTDIYVKLSINLKSGMIGRKFQQSFLNENDAINAEYCELWVGLNSEKLVFYDQTSLFAELHYFGGVVHFFTNNKPEIFNANKKTIEFTANHLSECLILLVNIPSPSEKLKILISTLESFDQHYRSAG